MKKLLMVASLCAVAMAQPSADLRAFYMDRTFENGSKPAQSMNVGGILKYQKQFGDANTGFAYYSSFQLDHSNTAPGTSLVQANGDSISFLGEAYVEYKGVKVGRQRLNTPLMNDHDLRMLPSTYQGVVANYENFQVGYITKYSGFVSKYSGFRDMNNNGYTYVMYSGNGATAQIVRSNDKHVAIEGYGYADYKIGGLQVQAGFNDYGIQRDSYMLGAKYTHSLDGIDVAILTNQIHGNKWKAIESGAMYSDWQQGYADYAISNAYGIQAGNSLLKVGAVRVIGNTVDDFTEYQLDSNYQIDKNNKVRLRYSYKDQTDGSGKEDRADFRAIYYLSF